LPFLALFSLAGAVFPVRIEHIGVEITSYYFGSARLFPSYLSVLSLMKNEAPYVCEWIEYHLIVGVDKFWLVDHDSEDNPEEVLQPYIIGGIVSLSKAPGRGRQFEIYNNFLPILKPQAFWVAIIDLDEYIVPVEGRSISEIMHNYECFAAIALNWVVFGSNGKLRREPGLVIERFRNHTDWTHFANRYTKAITQPLRVEAFDCHDHSYVGGEHSRNTRGQENTRWLLIRDPVYDIMRIHHYWIKSIEEFAAKRARGRASKRDPPDPEDQAKRMKKELEETQDVITDDHILDWAIPLVKERLNSRQGVFHTGSHILSGSHRS
jgi:hypothetical protein